MKTPKISIIIPVYNTEKYLEHCLDSLINQSFKDIEIICIDDCSTDKSNDILRRYSKQNQNIRILKTERNSGISIARNLGIDQAKAEYILFCDSDDYFDEEMCAKMYQAISDHDTDLAICEINIIYQAHRDMKISDDNYYALKYSGLQGVNENLIFFTDLAPTNKIFKKSLINEYCIRFPENLHYEDAYFCSAYFCISKTAYYVNERLYNYIRHDNSVMSDTWSEKSDKDIAIDHLYIAFRLFDFLNQNHLINEYNELFWRLFESFEIFAINNSKSKAQVKVIKESARNFINEHQQHFDQANATVRENIRHISAKNRFYLSPVRLKKTVMRFMPTYRYATENIQRLRTLKVKNKQLLDKIHEGFKESWNSS